MGERADEIRRRDIPDTVDDATSELASSPEDAETAAIREDLDQTRAEMGKTIDAIQQKLSPDVLAEQAKDAVREATVGKVEEVVRNVKYTAQDVAQGAGETAGEARYTIFETIKHNPVPAALVGLGLGWLWMNRERQPAYKSASYRRYSGAASAPPAWERGWSGYPGSQSYAPPRSAGQGEGAMHETVDRAKGAAGGLADQAQETAGQVADRVQDTAGQVQETAGHMADAAQHGAQRARSRFDEVLEENPLVIGAAALALGAVAGLSVPQTRQEHHLMGEARDSLMEKAQTMAQETMEKVQHVAQEAQSSAQQESRNQGLTQ